MLHNTIITLTILALKQCTGQEYTATSTCSVTASPNVSTTTTANSVAQKSRSKFQDFTDIDVLILRHSLLLKEEERVNS